MEQNRVGVEDLVKLGSLQEMFKHKGAKSSADVRCNVLAEWWLNQVTFRERVLRFALPCSFRCSRYSVSALNPVSRSALSYNGLASAKTSSLLEMSVKRRLIEAGRFLIILGGWFDW